MARGQEIEQAVHHPDRSLRRYHHRLARQAGSPLAGRSSRLLSREAPPRPGRQEQGAGPQGGLPWEHLRRCTSGGVSREFYLGRVRTRKGDRSRGELRRRGRTGQRRGRPRSLRVRSSWQLETATGASISGRQRSASSRMGFNRKLPGAVVNW